MSIYMLVTKKCAPHKVAELNELLGHLIEPQQAEGFVFHGRYATAVGELGTVRTVWELEDEAHYRRAAEKLALDAEYRKWGLAAHELILSESVEFLRRIA